MGVAEFFRPGALSMTTDIHPRRKRARPRSRGVYLLPNLFTTAVLFSGFYAIVAATDGNFDRAGMAVFIAMVCDGLDGRIARWTNTQSEFGAQYDSLSDMVAFGLAPADRRLPVGRGPHRRVRLPLGPARAGWRRSSMPPASPSAWRASTPRSTRPTSVSSKACPARRARRCWRVSSGCWPTCSAKDCVR